MAKIVHLRNIKRALRLEPSDGSKLIKFTIAGRVDNFRTYKSFNFIDLVDGSTKEHLQVVIKKDLLRKPELGSYLVCQGDITSSPGSQQAIEFKVDQLNYLGNCDPLRYPLAETNKCQLPDGWYRQNLHLRPRASHFGSLLRVRSELEMSLHMILKQMDFFKVHTPILTANDSEASSDLFMVKRSKYSDNNKQRQSSSDPSRDDDDDSDSSDESLPNYNSGDERGDYSRPTSASISNSDSVGKMGAEERHLKDGYFKDKDVFMMTSAQLHLESLAASLSRVYCLAPAFRAESTLSQRHLCEFTMLEAEEANVTSLASLMDRVESIVKFCAQYLGEVSEFRGDFASLLSKYSNETIYHRLTDSKYIRMTYDEAIEILARRMALDSPPHPPPTGSQPSTHSAPHCQYGCDLNRKHERALLEHCNQVPIFLTNYPKSLKPFYMKSCDDSPDKVHNFDLIAPLGGEICGGSLREDNLEMLRKNLILNGAGGVGGNGNHRFDWYLELREFGSYPHGGFGIGLERLIQSLLGIRNIKDTIAFPRWPGNCSM